MNKGATLLFYRIHTRKINTLISTRFRSRCLKATATPHAWLTHQKNKYQFHTNLTQIEGMIKVHLAKLTLDREALDTDMRYISESEKVDAERRMKVEAAEAEQTALAKIESEREKARLKAEEKKRIADERNRLISPILSILLMT